MREPVKDRDRLEHIIEAIDRVLGFADGKTIEQLEADNLKYYGIVKNIEIIGEAAYMLTKAFRQLHPETPWEFIAKMRHVLVHDYYQINTKEVYKVIRDDLHPLREQVTRYLAETDWDEWEKNEVAISESATHKALIQMATRMKSRGYDVDEICKITGLSRDEIDWL